MRSEIDKIISGKIGEIYAALLDGVTQYCAPDEPGGEAYAADLSVQEGDDFVPHKFVGEAYRQYLRRYPNKPSVNGRIFEYLVCETLAREGVVPFYCQAQFAFVPSANFDVVLFHPRRPVVLSMTVSLRKRYKQADLEGNALHQVYRNAECYLITLSHKEVDSVNRKIKSGDIGGLRACIIADSPEYSTLIQELKSREFDHATPITPITGTVYPVSSR